MSDWPSVVAAYAVTIGGLLLYVASVARRRIRARQVADALAAQRDRDAPEQPGAEPSARVLEAGR